MNMHPWVQALRLMGCAARGRHSWENAWDTHCSCCGLPIWGQPHTPLTPTHDRSFEWVTRAGDRLKLREIGNNHLRNIKRYLETRPAILRRRDYILSQVNAEILFRNRDAYEYRKDRITD